MPRRTPSGVGSVRVASVAFRDGARVRFFFPSGVCMQDTTTLRRVPLATVSWTKFAAQWFENVNNTNAFQSTNVLKTILTVGILYTNILSGKTFSR